jgi:hypothetical protein
METGFVRVLIHEGCLRVGAEPTLSLTDADCDVLRSALVSESLHLPGPRLEGSLPVLVTAIGLVYRLGWRLLNPEPIPPADDLTLRMPAPPRSPEEHLGADVAFRFLPGLYQRAFNRDPEDPLVRAMRTLLRQWPLSGVLADISEPPETPIDFDGHIGLGFLFAQRLAARERPTWFPNGPARNCLEVVYHALGKKVAALPPAALPSADAEVKDL